MGKYSGCVNGISDSGMRYPELHKQYRNLDGGIIMHKLSKDGAIRAA